MFKKILVPLDGSQLAEAALPLASELALRNDATLFLLNVQVRIPYFFLTDAPATFEELSLKVRASASDYLKRTTAAQVANGVRAQSILLDGGVADQRILEESARLGVDLIVLATHGFGGVVRALLGSVADRIVHQARIPVLLVRPDPDARA